VNVSGRSTYNHLLTDLKNGATYSISIVGISEHFFSDSVDYPNSIPLSEFFSKYILLKLHSKEYRISSNRRLAYRRLWLISACAYNSRYMRLTNICAYRLWDHAHSISARDLARVAKTFKRTSVGGL